MMSRQNLVIDAWMREAQEAVKLVEDIETRVKSKNNIVEVATKSKLLEVGVKLDRLESLLHKSQPPFKTHFGTSMENAVRYQAKNESTGSQSLCNAIPEQGS
ncbi:hypothetical protein QYF36_006841 [Acer negundo]|nr:hypothetical protein QYF36_006841 [Acer negundo]